ncbi:hypothetical protein [Nocardia sp. NPDC058666]|uniref:hypothetical protein n=1 Tax=Nocardia sp. NPDC058666 TaxID=3346587 RepID=UPI003654ABD1
MRRDNRALDPAAGPRRTAVARKHRHCRGKPVSAGYTHKLTSSTGRGSGRHTSTEPVLEPETGDAAVAVPTLSAPTDSAIAAMVSGREILEFITVILDFSLWSIPVSGYLDQITVTAPISIIARRF